MNVSYQKCDSCGAVNTTQDANWVRLFGVFKGTPALVSTATATPLAPGTVRAVATDICTDCITKLNVLDLVSLTTKVATPSAAATASGASAAKT